VNQVTIAGIDVRKGSVAAFVANALLLREGPSPEAEAHLRAVIPALRALRLFEVFEVRDPRLRELVDRA
jgi:hypothetical protein